MEFVETPGGVFLSTIARSHVSAEDSTPSGPSVMAQVDAPYFGRTLGKIHEIGLKEQSGFLPRIVLRGQLFTPYPQFDDSISYGNLGVRETIQIEEKHVDCDEATGIDIFFSGRQLTMFDLDVLIIILKAWYSADFVMTRSISISQRDFFAALGFSPDRRGVFPQKYYVALENSLKRLRSGRIIMKARRRGHADFGILHNYSLVDGVYLFEPNPNIANLFGPRNHLFFSIADRNKISRDQPFRRWLYLHLKNIGHDINISLETLMSRSGYDETRKSRSAMRDFRQTVEKAIAEFSKIDSCMGGKGLFERLEIGTLKSGKLALVGVNRSVRVVSEMPTAAERPVHKDTRRAGKNPTPVNVESIFNELENEWGGISRVYADYDTIDGACRVVG